LTCYSLDRIFNEEYSEGLENNFFIREDCLLSSSLRLLESLLDHIDESLKFTTDIIEGCFQSIEAGIEGNQLMASLNTRFCFTKLSKDQLIYTLTYITSAIIVFSKVTNSAKRFIDKMGVFILQTTMKSLSKGVCCCNMLLSVELFSQCSVSLQSEIIASLLNLLINPTELIRKLASKSLEVIIERNTAIVPCNNIANECFNLELKEEIISVLRKIYKICDNVNIPKIDTSKLTNIYSNKLIDSILRHCIKLKKMVFY